MPWRPKRPPIPWRTVAKVLLPIVALVVLIEGVAHVREQRSPPVRARTLKERAQLHRQVGQLEEAARALEEAAGLQPDDAQAPVLLAHVRQAQGKLEEAERVLRAAHEAWPHDPLVAVPLARLLLDTGRPLEAAEVLEPELTAIRKITDPLRRVDALLVAGQAAAGRGALLQAEALLREATRVGPAPVTTVAKAAAEACLALGDLLTRSGRLGAARDALDAARTYTPWDARIALGRARVLELAGQTDDAVAQLRPLVEAPAGPDLAAAAALADVLLRARRTEEVAALASRVEAAATGRELAGAMRAAAALGSGDAAHALAAAARFVEAHPGSAAAQLAQGRAALNAGSLETARASLETALSAAPGLAEAAVGLLEVEERGRDADATRARGLALLDDAGTRAFGARALLTLAVRDEGSLAAGCQRLEALAASHPADARLRAHLGLLRLATGDVQSAAADLEALVSAPDLASASSVLADTPDGMQQGVLAVESLGVLLLRGGVEAAPGARRLTAQALERLDRVGMAMAVLGEVGRPPDREATALRVRLAVRAGTFARALEALAALQTEAPDDGAVLAALGELRLLAGDAAGARTVLEQAARALPASAAVHARLGRALAALGDRRGAEASYARARGLGARLSIAHEDAALPLTAGDADTAVARLSAALEATGDARFAFALAVAHAAAGRAGQGLEALRRAGAGGPPGSDLLIVALLAEAGQGERARALAQRLAAPPLVREAAAGAGPDRPARRILWALVALSALDWHAEARGRVDALLDDAQADALSLWWAWQVAEGRDAPLAVRVGDRLARLAPEDALVALRLAAARGVAGDAGGDAALVRRVHERGVDEPRLLVELGMALERVGQPAQAEARYREALASGRRPDGAVDGSRRAIAHNNLAWLLSASPGAGRRHEALAHAREAVRLAPTAAEALDTLGWAHHLLGQDHEALGLLERAAARLPGDATVRFHAAEVLLALGRTDQARLVLEGALLLPAGWPEEARARARLEELGRVGR